MRTLALGLVVLSSLRLGIIGFFGNDVVGSLFGSAPVVMSTIDRVICAIAGIAGIYSIYILTIGRDNEVIKE